MSLSEQEKRGHLAPVSGAFSKHAQEVSGTILPQSTRSDTVRQRLPALELQEALIPPLPFESMHTVGFGVVCEPVGVSCLTHCRNDLVRRFTRIIVLHW